MNIKQVVSPKYTTFDVPTLIALVGEPFLKTALTYSFLIVFDESESLIQKDLLDTFQGRVRQSQNKTFLSGTLQDWLNTFEQSLSDKHYRKLEQPLFVLYCQLYHYIEAQDLYPFFQRYSKHSLDQGFYIT